jgi:hypothetical protein
MALRTDCNAAMRSPTISECAAGDLTTADTDTRSARSLSRVNAIPASGVRS